jgi:hypothetical protein
LDEDVVEHVLAIIAEHHSDKTIDTREFRVLWDADWLVNIPDEFDLEEKTSLGALVVKVFKTAAGREMAEKKFL